jgi:small conductance mechanosensitive channel
MAMKLRVKTVPQKQWEVGRELRKRLRQALNLHGIEIPYPAINIPKTSLPPPASAP